MKDEECFRHRVLDLANRCYQKNIYTFSGFLSVGEISELYAMERELRFVPWTLYGGGTDCERQMLRFGSKELLGYEEEFPIRCLAVRPRMQRFSDELNHRDFLGALMHLGIERDILGDIIVKENQGYVFCETQMAEYLAEHLDRVKHTSVVCEILTESPAAAAPELTEEELVVSAERADAVIAKLYHLSRTQSTELFRQKRVFVNGRQYENNSGSLSPGDIVSVRGFGKFIFTGSLGETKKGRIRIGVRLYST